MSSISKYECQKIAWRVKALCDGCPEFLTYYDIKDSLLSKSSRLNIYFSNKKNFDELFQHKNISEDLLDILSSMSSGADIYDLRRIALVHGMIQYPLVHGNNISNKDHFINELKHITHNEERHELQYIFINSVLNSLSDDNKIIARKNIKIISDLKENGYEEDSLFSQFMKLNSQSNLVTRIPDNANYVSRGETKIPSKEIALKLLFSFEPIDFQDIEWVGGFKKFDKTYQMPLKKRKILEILKDLNELSFTDSLNYFS